MLDKAIESKQITTNVRTAKELAAQQRYDALLHRVEIVRASPKEKEAFNISELRTLVLWYKDDGDAAIPNKRQELLERYVATCMRQELARPFPLKMLVQVERERGGGVQGCEAVFSNKFSLQELYYIFV